MQEEVPFGPTGLVVYERTYSRTKPDGSKETWPETVRRVAKGNLALVHGQDMEKWPLSVLNEYKDLVYYMDRFAILPAGRHLWATGVEGRQFLFNCHVSGWGEKLSDHFFFTSMRLFEGGGVGANYSMKHIRRFGPPVRPVKILVTCRDDHENIKELESKLADDPATSYILPWVVEDSREGWARAMEFLIDSAYRTDLPVKTKTLVFDVSNVRPSGAPLVSSGGTASGPGPLATMLHDIGDTLNDAFECGELSPLHAMEIDHAIAEAVVSGGTRRSARMAIVHWNDPYIAEFLECKANTGKHWTTNISVEIDNEFIDLLNKNEVNQAHKIHSLVSAAMLRNGEPGYWNSSLSQIGEVGEVIATNPCGEIALEAWENCNLGHINLDYFAPKRRGDQPDFQGMYTAHRLITRFLMRATFGDVTSDVQRDILNKNRRIGVGHLGVQGYWAKQGIKYSNIPGAMAEDELRHLKSLVRREAQAYAFKLRIPEPVKVTTVAPTGSVAKLPGVSEGIHPIYARWFERRVRFSLRDEAQFNMVQEFINQGFEMEQDVYDKSGMTAVVVFPTEDILMEQVRALGYPDAVVESADQISVEDMLRVQRLYQQNWADNAVSYTVNVPEGKVTPEQLAETLKKYLPSLKGTTLMVDATRPQAPYTRITHDEYLSAAAKTQEDSNDLECSTGACPVK